MSLLVPLCGLPALPLLLSPGELRLTIVIHGAHRCFRFWLAPRFHVNHFPFFVDNCSHVVGMYVVSLALVDPAECVAQA